jgi:hypothetical protein
MTSTEPEPRHRHARRRSHRRSAHARIAAFATMERAECPNTMLFVRRLVPGTLFFNFFKGEAEFKPPRPDTPPCPGNHEFDEGAALIELLKTAPTSNQPAPTKPLPGRRELDAVHGPKPRRGGRIAPRKTRPTVDRKHLRDHRARPSNPSSGSCRRRGERGRGDPVSMGHAADPSPHRTCAASPSSRRPLHTGRTACRSRRRGRETCRVCQAARKASSSAS